MKKEVENLQKLTKSKSRSEKDTEKRYKKFERIFLGKEVEAVEFDIPKSRVMITFKDKHLLFCSGSLVKKYIEEHDV